MKRFDVIVVGSGAGLEVASFADENNLKVALIEEGPLGGTCLNRGCIPSKMLIHSAEVAETIQNSEKFGIKAKVESIDFQSIVKRVTVSVDEDSAQIERAVRQSRNLTLFKTKGKFTGPKRMFVGDEEIEADKVFIVGGTRPFIPPILGIENVKILTSTEALRLEKQPEHLVIVGGGYIGCELAYFFSSLGTKVTMIVRGNSLLAEEDEEVSKWFTDRFSKRVDVLFNTETASVSQNGEEIKLKLKDGKELIADQLLLATGRVPNTDILEVKASGVELTEKGFIKVNEYLETNVPGVWSFGDIVGKLPFRHTANDQLGYAIRNAFSEHKVPFDYFAIPHAVFSSPQIGGVGKTEQTLKKEGVRYKVGKAFLKDTGMGAALQEDGFVKVLVAEDSETIIGCHIVGPQASTLIHEAVIAMKATGKVSAIGNSVYVHPALSEVVQRAFSDVG